MAAALHAMGRIPWCACGIGLATTSAWSNETSQHLLDPYSFSHVLHGVAFYVILHFALPRAPWQWRLFGALLLEVGWEILENSPIIIDRYRAGTAALDYTGDSILNALGDVGSCMLGYWITVRWRWQATLAAVVAVELIMLALFRDNLTLNVVMLLYPIDAIREWQLAR